MLLVLTGVTAISVALLAYVNELTKGPIAEANAKTLSDAISIVVPAFDNNPTAEATKETVNGVERRTMGRRCCRIFGYGFWR